jgi:hypothetical protein
MELSHHINSLLTSLSGKFNYWDPWCHLILMLENPVLPLSVFLWNYPIFIYFVILKIFFFISTEESSFAYN